MGNPESIDVVVYPVGMEGVQVSIEAGEDGSYLGALQELVGGNIEYFRVAEGMPFLVVNEEGLFGELPNRAVYATKDMEEAGFLSQIDGEPVRAGGLYAVLHGTIVAVGVGEDGETASADPEQVGRLERSGHLGGPGSWVAEVIRRMRESE